MSQQNHSHDPNKPQPPETGAGPTVKDEEKILTAEFGKPNQDGIYGAVVEE